MPKKLTRRKFLELGSMVTVSDPILSIVEALLNSTLITKAQAEGPQSKRYVYIQQQQAPPRWMFDLFLNPSNTSNIPYNPYIATEYRPVSGKHTESRYRLININDNYVPPIWNMNLPAPNGANRKLKSVLENMVHLRGINTGNASHPFCQKLHYKPLGAIHSVNASAADYSDAPIPGVNMGSSAFQFSSKGNLAPVGVSGSNYISSIMEPFKKRGPASFNAKYDSVKDQIRNVIYEMDRLSGVSNASNGPTKKALNIIDQNWDTDAINQEWSLLLAKYNDLVNRAIQGTYPNINNREIPIVRSGSKKDWYRHTNSQLRGAMDDVRQMIKATTSVRNLAPRFAALEFIIKNDLSRSVVMETGRMYGLDSPNTFHNVDEHGTGKMISILINQLYYSAIGACFLEFVAMLKQSGKWNDTLIDFGGEFNRRPKANGSGSDHGHEGASVALYGGAIQGGPWIVGDILRAEGGNTYGGCWGKGGSNALSVGHYASTAAMLLGVPSVVTAFPSVLKRRPNGTLTYNTGFRKGRFVSS